MRRHPFFDELEASLAGVVASEPVELSGSWLPTTRRTYTAESQSGTGSGPFADVVDFRWQGQLSCAVPIAGIAFLATASKLFWSKSTPPASPQELDVSLHAYADFSQGRATFIASIAGAVLPGIAVAFAGDPAAVRTLGNARLTTARVEPLAETEEAAFFALLLPAPSLKIGRHRLWRLREELTSSLPPRILEILTRRRSGSIPWESRRGDRK